MTSERYDGTAERFEHIPIQPASASIDGFLNGLRGHFDRKDAEIAQLKNYIETLRRAGKSVVAANKDLTRENAALKDKLAKLSAPTMPCSLCGHPVGPSGTCDFSQDGPSLFLCHTADHSCSEWWRGQERVSVEKPERSRELGHQAGCVNLFEGHSLCWVPTGPFLKERPARHTSDMLTVLR